MVSIQKVLLVENATAVSSEFMGMAEPEIPIGFDETIFTHHTTPHKAERVQKILELVTIGPDLNSDQRK